MARRWLTTPPEYVPTRRTDTTLNKDATDGNLNTRAVAHGQIWCWPVVCLVLQHFTATLAHHWLGNRCNVGRAAKWQQINGWHEDLRWWLRYDGNDLKGHHGNLQRRQFDPDGDAFEHRYHA